MNKMQLIRTILISIINAFTENNERLGIAGVCVIPEILLATHCQSKSGK